MSILLTYEVRVLNEDARIETHVIRETDDLAALTAALPFCKTQSVEIWRDGQCMVELKRGALPLDVIWTGCG